MKIISYNVNGIRSALSKAFVDFLKAEQADVVCLQELKAQASDIPSVLFENLGYHCYYYPAQKKGYSGVGILTKIKPEAVSYGMGHDLFDAEGRVMGAMINGKLVVSAYFPSGTTGDIRQQVKYEFLDQFYDWVQKHPHKAAMVICGDYNICHNPIDIHDPIANKNNSGFLPEERAWMDKWFTTGMMDAFRTINQEADQYTWWSFRTNARARNKGWRIDYISVAEHMAEQIADAGILSNYVHSDHCGIYVKMQ
jgi:exodeoxyribonuclease-3